MVKKNYDDILSRFYLIPEHDGRTDRIAISISRVGSTENAGPENGGPKKMKEQKLQD